MKNPFILKWALICILAPILLMVSPASSADASFRVIHLSPNSPAFDFCNNGDLFGGDVSYTETTGYEPVLSAPGNNTFIRYFSGHGCVPGLELNTTAFPPLADGSAVTAVAIGSLFTLATGIIGPPALVLGDDNSNAPGGLAKVRFINLALDGSDPPNPIPAGDVDFASDDGVHASSVAAIITQTIFPPIAYELLPRGRYDFEIRDSISGDVLAEVPRLKLKSRGVYTIIFHGDTSGGLGVDVFVSRDDKNRGRPVKGSKGSKGS